MSGKPETPDELLEAIRNARMTMGVAEEGSPEWRSAAWDLMNHTAALDFLLTQKEPLPANWHRAMTKVYLATAGEYSSFRVLHAFASEEDAETYKLAEADAQFAGDLANAVSAERERAAIPAPEPGLTRDMNDLRS